MKIEQLRYFLEAARQEHIGRAAEVVAISPSAISHSIAALERELGRELFVKRGKRVRLTSHGKLLMERAGRFINELEAIKDELAADHVDLQGYYRLAATHVLSSRFLAPAWSAVQRGHAGLLGAPAAIGASGAAREEPGLRAEIHSLRSAQVIAGVAGGEYDFGLCFNPQPHPALDASPLYSGQILLAVRRGHPALRRPAAEAVKELGRHPAALPKAFHGVDNCETHPAFRRFGLEPRTDLVFDSYEVAVGRVLSSDAWSFLPDFMFRLYPGLAPLVPRGWKAELRVCAVRPRHRLPTRVLRRLSTELRKLF